MRWLCFSLLIWVSSSSLQIIHRITFVNPPAITPEWKRKVAQDAIESLSAAKLARSICSQFRTRLNSSHEAFATSLRQVKTFSFALAALFFPIPTNTFPCMILNIRKKLSMKWWWFNKRGLLTSNSHCSQKNVGFKVRHHLQGSEAVKLELPLVYREKSWPQHLHIVVCLLSSRDESAVWCCGMPYETFPGTLTYAERYLGRLYYCLCNISSWFHRESKNARAGSNSQQLLWKPILFSSCKTKGC